VLMFNVRKVNSLLSIIFGFWDVNYIFNACFDIKKIILM
jgi:hypothetical protein